MNSQPSSSAPSPTASNAPDLEQEYDEQDANANNNEDNDASSRPGARKDRPCPFCHQPFTSSSLGRHLDTFIRGRHQKPPDGIHDVDKIRAMRNKITRRHARSSSKADPSKMANGAGDRTPVGNRLGTPGSMSQQHKPQPLEPDLRHPSGTPTAPASAPTPPYQAFEQSAEGGGMRSLPQNHVYHPHQNGGRLGWQNTGVINDIPSSRGLDVHSNNSYSTNSTIHRSSTSHPFSPSTYPNSAAAAAAAAAAASSSNANSFPYPDAATASNSTDPYASQPEALHVRALAAESALKDILAHIRDATARANEAELLEHDAFDCNFPGMCFKILPPPPGLFSTTPEPVAQSAEGCWSLHPPGEREYNALMKSVTSLTSEEIHTTPGQSGDSDPNSGSNNKDDTSPSTDSTNPIPPKLAEALNAAPRKFLEALSNRAVVHLRTVYDSFRTLSQDEQSRIYTLELQRALGAHVSREKELRRLLQSAKSELDHVRLELEAALDERRDWMGFRGLSRLPTIHGGVAREIGGLSAVDKAGVNLMSPEDGIKKSMDRWQFDRVLDGYRASAAQEARHAYAKEDRERGSRTDNNNNNNTSQTSNGATSRGRNQTSGSSTPADTSTQPTPLNPFRPSWSQGQGLTLSGVIDPGQQRPQQQQQQQQSQSHHRKRDHGSAFQSHSHHAQQQQQYGDERQDVEMREDEG